MWKRFLSLLDKEALVPKTIHQEMLCCGYKRCPVVKLLDDGSIELSDDDTESGSVGTIKLLPEATVRLVELIAKRNL
jgi:hypothetical protein